MLVLDVISKSYLVIDVNSKRFGRKELLNVLFSIFFTHVSIFFRPSLRLHHPALSLSNSRIKTSKRDQALSSTSQCERRSYQRRHNARGDVIKLAFVKRKTVLG